MLLRTHNRLSLISSDKRHVFLISIGKLHVLIILLLYYLADQNPEIEIGSDLLDSSFAGSRPTLFVN